MYEVCPADEKCQILVGSPRAERIASPSQDQYQKLFRWRRPVDTLSISSGCHCLVEQCLPTAGPGASFRELQIWLILSLYQE